VAERVDARGLSCPQPVLLARQALDAAAGGKVEVWVDSAAARDGIRRLARALGLQVEVSTDGETTVLTIGRPGA